MPTETQPATTPFGINGIMTDPGRYASLLDGLPADVEGLAAVGHGLLIHEFMTGGYGVTAPEGEHPTVHLRRVEQLLGEIVKLDDSPLTQPRPPERRVLGNCRHFTVLMTTMLRTQGIPARARCGFGNYFGTGWDEDHWVTEYWHAGHDRWQLVDAQIDEVQLGWFPVDFDLTDVPRDKFLVGGQAWQLYRSGQADPAKFGLSNLPESGDWWIVGNLMRDALALLGLELLPWDVWGEMPKPDLEIDAELTALFDRLAELTLAPDAHLAELRELVEGDDRLRVRGQVRNAVRDRIEPL
jgi:hypothetical protein